MHAIIKEIKDGVVYIGERDTEYHKGRITECPMGESFTVSTDVFSAKFKVVDVTGNEAVLEAEDNQKLIVKPHDFLEIEPNISYSYSIEKSGELISRFDDLVEEMEKRGVLDEKRRSLYEDIKSIFK